MNNIKEIDLTVENINAVAEMLKKCMVITEVEQEDKETNIEYRIKFKIGTDTFKTTLLGVK